MIDNVRDTVHDFLEKNNMGWLKPERFNNYAYLSQMEVYEEYFYDLAKWLTGRVNRQSGDGYADIPDQIKQKLDRFHKIGAMTQVSGSRFTAPADAYKIIDIYYQNRVVEKADATRIVRLESSNLTAPDVNFPVYNQIESQYLLYPTTIDDNVSCSYFRKPLDPVWTYRSVAGNPVFDNTLPDYQDFEIHPADEVRLIVKILGYTGLSVREADVIQYAETQEQQKKQTERRQ